MRPIDEALIRLCNMHPFKSYQQARLLPLVKLLLVLISCFWSTGIAMTYPLKEREKEAMTLQKDSYTTGRLTARPNNQTSKENFTVGVQSLKLSDKRDGFIYVPRTYTKNRPAALALMLHGAGGQAEHGLSLLKQYADDHTIILVALASRAATWDIIVRSSFGPDVILMDQTLQLVFERYTIDSSRIAIGGFSDGASYALCIGLTNGDLFTHILAFSPGFVHTIEKKGKPAVFISHGTNDQVLPITACSRRIVPQLRRQELQVNYQEFEGEHQIPANIARSAVEWFTRNDVSKH